MNRRVSSLLTCILALPLSHRAAVAAESLFASERTGNVSGPENTAYELGTVFRASMSGAVTHLRVYAVATETGLHTARLWNNTAGTVVSGPHAWSYGGVTGWITLDIPDVPILADTDYTVVVSTGGTNGSGNKPYPFRAGDLAVAGGNGQNLTHPANAGVFTTTVGTRPVSTFNSANYYRDVVFSATPPEPPVEAPVRINEFVAENNGGLRDEDGDASDWIELYNPRGTAVDLTGYQLTDGTATWVFSAAEIGAQSFVVVFASGKNRTAPSWHTNFKLEQAGECLALKDAGGTVISESAAAYPNQRENVAWGRGTAGNTGYLPVPTPGNFNGTAYEGFIPDTNFSVRRGIFTDPFTVALTTAMPDAEIRYTLNGSIPSESSLLYATPLAISSTTTLRARAFKPNWLPTNTDTNTYLFPGDVITQTSAGAQAYGWPSGPVNGLTLRYGTNSPAASLYTPAQKTAALTQVPSVSIVTDQADLTGPATGVYVNAESPDFERPGSLELINPDGTTGFQIDCGLRMRGGQSRGDAFPKKSFNFFFRNAYGAGKLSFPLFGPDGAREFDTLSLHCEHGYAYADPYGIQYRLDFTNLRDVFCRDLWGAAGYQTTRSRPYHLYVNGQYWGLYETQERAGEDHGATYFGGSAEEYDLVVATGLPERETAVGAGTIAAWQALWSGARAVNASPTNANYFALLGRNEDGTPHATLPVLLDPRELVGFMLLHYYTGHADAPLSVSFNYERPNNFRCLRRRGATEPWHFFVHDAESSTRAGEWDANRVSDNLALLTSPNRNNILYSNPEWIHEDLLANAEYRIAFADETQRLLLNDGAFTATRGLALWNARAALINEAVIGESIRWAQSSQENQANWNAEVNDVRNNFFPVRSATVLGQLRARGLFPSVEAPVFSQRGGQVSVDFQLSLTAAAGGTIYVTTDGSDPRAIGGTPSVPAYAGPVTISGPLRVRARYLSSSGEWSALDEVFFTTLSPATAANLALTKIHYHPLPPSAAESAAGFTDSNDFEYLEFRNTTGAAIDLRSVQVNAGVAFTFPAMTLAAGARVVIAENSAAFAMRYGTVLPLAGAFTGNLSNGGETVRVVDAAGSEIALVTYDDAAPWPGSADGAGPCLILRDPALNPALSASWRASYVTGGKPGEEDAFTLTDWRAEHFSLEELSDPEKESTLWGNSANPDNDDAANLIEYALGSTSPRDAASGPQITSTFFTEGGQTFLRATYPLREGTSGLTVAPEVSTNLTEWQPLTPVSSISQGDGTARVTVQSPEPVAAGMRRYVRVRITVP
jgi:hypothetical protein